MHLWAFVSRRLILVSLVGLLCGGCVVVPVPLPGVKSGRAVSEETPGSLEPGAPFADVILQLGEPDSVSADGRTIVYRFSRTWGMLLAASFPGAAGGVPIIRSEGIVATFDEEFRLLKIERRGGKWTDTYGRDGAPGDARVFGHAIFEPGTPLGDEKANVCWKSSIWTNSTAPPAAGLVEAMRELPLKSTVRKTLWVSGQAALSDSSIWFRRDFATGTSELDTMSMPLEHIKEIASTDRGTERPCAAILSDTGRMWLLEIPAETEENSATLSAVREWFAKGGLGLRNGRDVAATSASRGMPEGWTCIASFSTGKRFWRHIETRYGTVWITEDGLRFVPEKGEEELEQSRHIPWSRIARVKRGIVHLTDGETITFTHVIRQGLYTEEYFTTASVRVVGDAIVRHQATAGKPLEAGK